jgi:hypothetical protein
MSRRPSCIAWLILLITVPGCGDNIGAILRDYYNIEHEILDNMSMITDDESAKKFNEIFDKRLKDREASITDRKEGLDRRNPGEADKKAITLEADMLENGLLKAQIASLDSRFRILQNRQRRLLVKLTEDQAELAKAKGESFTIDAGKNWPNLSATAVPDKLGKSPNAGGMGGGMMPAMMPMQPPGGPGGGGPPGAGGPAAAPPGMPAVGPQGAGQQQAAPAGPAVDPKYNQIRFILTCERIGNAWVETRAWKLGNSVVYSNKEGAKLLSPDGVDLTPLTSN